MTTLDGARFLEEQLESIVAQSPPPAEIVVGDDGSTDRTGALIEAARARCPVPIRSIGGTHVGLRANVERVLNACRGDVIALSDQDDVWLPGRMRAIEDSFAEPGVMLWFSDADLIDEVGRAMGRRLWESVGLSHDALEALTGGRQLRRLLHGMTVTGATMAFRADVLPLAVPFPSELDGPDHLFLHDGWIAVLASLRGDIVADPRVFTRYRQHGGQFTGMQVARSLNEDQTRHRRASRGDLAKELGRVRLVLDRLREREALEQCRPEDATMLRELDELLSVRASAFGPERLLPVMRLLVAGRYRTYARGWRTAVGDLLLRRR